MVKPDPVVWNPYLGQVRLIKPSKKLYISYKYCMGYDNKNNHKILRRLFYQGTVEYEIYDFKSDSWRVLDVTCNWIIHHYRQGFSLKGNTYFVAQGREEGKGDSVILSSVGEEQLAVLFHRVDTYEIEIRITTKIEADDVTWTSFLKIDVEPFESSGMFWKFLRYGIFYVDEKNKAALSCDYHFSRAYVIGEDNYFKVVSLGESTGSPVVCSYVPSSMQIQKGQVDKAEELDGGGGNKTVVWLEDVGALVVTGLQWRRKKTIMTSRLS
ncbi:PREDICTED: putative F-box protein At3g19560 [Brassica oleracea var. oleracea]|uniref:putative F-box protein At3g19560 n=1 Tax=Brassica oleracea var. oleracea TaxID=109376 RepID=UPI0006A6C129|nr:PREDICTED: putative F-box protein At3g19560 [Brassica oleracea var. oleracea]